MNKKKLNMDKVLAGTQPFDASEHLQAEEEQIAYLQVMLEEGDPQMVAHALGVIARARSMTQLARDTGLTRNSLYKALSANGNPELSTVLKVASALGIRLDVSRIEPIPAAARSRRAASRTRPAGKRTGGYHAHTP